MHELYFELLRRLAQAPVIPSVRTDLSIGSHWGARVRDFRELVGETMTIDTDRVLLRSESRPLNDRYALASSAWIILGRNDLESIARFNKRGTAFSDDGETLSGAFGHRLRRDAGDQIEDAVSLLQHDPSSRRAVCFVGRPSDLCAPHRDYPCASLVQIFRRHERVELVVYMRSQSLIGVFPYDVVNFRYLQKYVAYRLGLLPGPLHFHFGSLHLYEDEIDLLNRLLSDKSVRFDALPDLPWDDLADQYDAWMSGPGRTDGLDDLLTRITEASL